MGVQCVECDKYIQGRTEEPLCQECAEADEQLTSLEREPQKKLLQCFKRINNGYMCTEYYESKTKDAVKRRNQLKKHGYGVSTNKFGYTTVGGECIHLTMVIITKNSHDDTYGIPISNTELVSDGKSRIENN